MRLVPIALSVSCAMFFVACADPPPAQPFKPTYSVLHLMEGPIAHAAEVYWDSVSTIVDSKGITENFPRSDEEWEAVWAAAITISESGNLLMMQPRAKDEDDWIKWASQLVDVGAEAAKAAESKDPEQILAEGERVYDVCTGCHMQYIPQD